MTQSRIVIEDVVAGDPPKFVDCTVYYAGSQVSFRLEVNPVGREHEPPASVYKEDFERLGSALTDAARRGAISVRSPREK